MSTPPLSRASGRARDAAPVRLVHLGLGNFFRAHQAWYTDRATDAEAWGIAGFTGRTSGVAEQLTAQEGLYTLVTRASDRDRFEVVASLSRAHAAADHDAWLAYLRSPELAAVTFTVTEAGYVGAPSGGLDAARAEIRAEVEALRRDPAALVATAPARLAAGLAARRRSGAGPVALVPCDNVAGNGAITARIVADFAELIDPALAAWIAESVSIVSTMVDRITPQTTPQDMGTVREATGHDDRAPVVSEPFTEWVLEGAFPCGRPRWEDAGATFTDDVMPFEHRKLWLLNGAHSLLAYAGAIRGHVTVADAVADDTCRGWLEQWWSEASPHLDLPAADLVVYRDALLERFANGRMHDRLERIAADGSQKLPIRIVPVLRAERLAGRLPEGATRVLAAWVCHLRGSGARISDARAEQVVPLAAGRLSDAVRRVLAELDPALGADPDVVASVVGHCEQLAPRSQR